MAPRWTSIDGDVMQRALRAVHRCDPGDAMSVTEEFLSAVPQLHSWDGGKTWNGGGFGRLELDVLIELAASGPGGSQTIIETGAGNSTIAFLLAGAAKLTSIAPDDGLFGRIREYCSNKAIPTDALNARVAFSEDCLPGIVTEMDAAGEKADLALIDGGHGWPTVFVDFCYLFRALRKGGFLVVDDIHIYSVKELARFLLEDHNVELVRRLPKTLVFKKLSDRRYLPDFGGQPYVVRQMEADKAAGTAFKL
jgi:hypothetical protein